MNILKYTTLKTGFGYAIFVSLVVPQVVIMTTWGASYDDKVVILTTVSFQWNVTGLILGMGSANER